MASHVRTTRRMFVMLALLLAASCAASAQTDEPAKGARRSVASIDLFTAGAEGFHTFRIPVLISSSRGTLLAFCEGRRDGIRDHGTIFLLLKRSFDRGKTWQPLQVVWSEDGHTSGNPAPVVDDTSGKILLLFCRNNSGVHLTESTDDGATWAKPRNITRQVRLPHWEWYATGPSPGLCLREGKPGRLVIPCNHSARLGDVVVGQSHAIYSDDQGATWQLGQGVPLPTTAGGFAAELERHEARERVTSLGTARAEPADPNKTPRTASRSLKSLFAGNEACIAELPDGRLMMNTRGSSPGVVAMRAISWSEDGGETWSGLQHDAALVEPTCHADLRSVASTVAGTTGAVLLFSNPAHPPIPDWDKGRQKMTVKLSLDGGRTWPAAKLLHDGPSSYSSLTVLPDGTVLCLFEGGEKHRREWLRLARFRLSELLDRR